MPINPLRSVPSVNELLESAPLRNLAARLGVNTIVSTVRVVLDEVRSEVQNAAAERTFPSVTELADRIAHRITETAATSLYPLINATGVLLNPEVDGLPLAEDALHEMAAAGRDFALTDVGVEGGRRFCRPASVEHSLRALTRR